MQDFKFNRRESPDRGLAQIEKYFEGGQGGIWKFLMQKYKSHRVAEVVRGHGGPPLKSLDSDGNFKPKHKLFCRELRFVKIYALFGNLWAKKCLLGQKQCFMSKKCTITWYILHVLPS